MILKRSYSVIACLLLFAFEVAAQPRSWDQVKAIAPGAEIRIAGPVPGILQGTLQSATDDSVVLTSSASQQSYPRQQITRVTVKRKGHRLRNTLIGVGVGAGTGLAIGVGSDHACASHGCFIGNNLGKAIFTPFGAIIGAIVGAVFPTGGWREVYKQ